ncbi:MAG: polysaccharide deacetylase family protein [Gemmatimonadales bacterium]|nr:polysaccharide deacetylase family protein [Gemmatimonadales bacterium]
MSERLFVFRWDVDHRVCVTDGLPRIRAVCRDFGVPNTFFVNMGRSTNLKEWLGKGVTRSKAKLADRDAVHLIQKTGWPRFVLETLLSRPVGLSFTPELQALQAEGHELGLHGGMDHVIWSRRFHTLPTEVLESDVDESYAHYLRHFGRPAGFSSPGFYSDERVMSLLDRLGFSYNGDGIGGEPQLAQAGGRPLQHWTIPVTLAGPRTIPFLEYHGARQTPDAEMLRQLDEHLESRDLVVLYGHPCYEGVREAVLRKVFAAVVERGFRFVTMQTLAERLQAAHATR